MAKLMQSLKLLFLRWPSAPAAPAERRAKGSTSPWMDLFKTTPLVLLPLLLLRFKLVVLLAAR
ncbi:MAG: hypothetical protein IT469_09260 [Pseudomonadales bacterium]|nr:hypothetical protein [Pseudomonadales bacterium]